MIGNTHCPAALSLARLSAAGIVASVSLMPSAAPGSAQGRSDAPAPVRELTNPDVFPQTFTRIAGLRELADGRVLIADDREVALTVTDRGFRSGARIGTEGGGPREYGAVGRLFAFPGDSTVMYDTRNRRYLVISPDARIVRDFQLESRMSMGNAEVRASAVPRRADARGYVYYDAETRVTTGRTMEGSDSTPIVRLNLTNGRADTVASISRVRAPLTTSNMGGGVTMSISRPTPFPQRDDWAVFVDGRMAIVRTKEYRVEYVTVAGQRIVGPQVLYEPIRVTEADKRAAAPVAPQSGSIRITGPGSERGGAIPAPKAADADWPSTKPPFLPNAVWAGPRGYLWVQRTTDASELRPMFDIFNSDGVRTQIVAGPPRGILVGFGARVAYFAVPDENDEQHLSRYRLPE